MCLFLYEPLLYSIPLPHLGLQPAGLSLVWVNFGHSPRVILGEKALGKNNCVGDDAVLVVTVA